jgi:hypothetical protein
MLRMKRHVGGSVQYEHVGPDYDRADALAQDVARSAEQMAQELANTEGLHFPEVIMLVSDLLQSRAMALVVREQDEPRRQ